MEGVPGVDDGCRVPSTDTDNQQGSESVSPTTSGACVPAAAAGGSPAAPVESATMNPRQAPGEAA